MTFYKVEEIPFSRADQELRLNEMYESGYEFLAMVNAGAPRWMFREKAKSVGSTLIVSNQQQGLVAAVAKAAQDQKIPVPVKSGDHGIRPGQPTRNR